MDLRQVLLICSLLPSAVLQHPQSSTHAWDYEREGPDAWPHLFDSCEGEAQSPVDIRLSQVHYDPHLPPLALNGYTTNSSTYVWNFTHSGRTITAHPPPLARLSLSGAGLTDVFFLVHFAVRWGHNIYQGSEHTIDGRKYPLEMQFVHQARASDTYAILSVLFELRREDNPRIDDLLSILNQTTDASIAIAHRLDISRLFSSTAASSPRYFRYQGSLTFPPCTEGVTWVILARPVPISARQLEIFTQNSVASNFRPPQKLFGRRIFANFQPEAIEEGHTSETNSNDHRSSATLTRLPSFLFTTLHILIFLSLVT